MHITRRTFIKSAIACAASSALPMIARAALVEPTRQLWFHNTHTGESLKTTYWELGHYNTEALKDIAYVLRDHRTDDMHAIEPRLLDLLAQLHTRIDSSKPFEVISGYRSPKSNALLFEHTRGVNANSLHMAGQAIDIRLSDRPLAALRDAAWKLQGGGVGYYPASRFIHMDTGAVNQWQMT